MSWRPGVPYLQSTPGLNLEAVATNQAKYLTRYSAAIAARDCDVINAGDSMSAVVAWRTWPYIVEGQMQRIVGSADVDVSSPSAGAAWRMLNLTQNAWSIQDHLDAGTLIPDCTSRQPDLVIISCGLVTWLTDKTGDKYRKGLKVGIESIRTVCEADILIVHQYEPELNLAEPNTWANWGEITEPIAREMADRLNCAYVSVFKPVGSIAGSGDPGGLFTLPSPATTDNVHVNGAGQEIIAGEILPILTRNRHAVDQPLPIDLGQSRSTSTAELSLLTAVMPIPANSLNRYDELLFSGTVTSINLSGSSATIVIRLKIGGTTVFTSAAIAIANGTGIGWEVICKIFAETVGGTSLIRCESKVPYGPGGGAALTATLTSSLGATPLTVSTLADINIDLTSQHGGTGGASAALITECTWATLSRVVRYR